MKEKARKRDEGRERKECAKEKKEEKERKILRNHYHCSMFIACNCQLPKESPFDDRERRRIDEDKVK